ncbi:hypothetical protein Adt_23503 [Abeliophyllum distichum]|uniref:Uncharacterized protein n=1 Tax=Abeliophyllum distichum TaxID=126358 RepID=A0ABD1SC55_9LAMI
MAGFHFTKILVFKIRGERVVDERHQRPSMAPTPEPMVPLAMEAVGDVSFTLSSVSMGPASVAVVSSTGKVKDESPSSPSVVEVRSGSSSHSLYTEVGGDPLLPPYEIVASPSAMFILKRKERGLSEGMRQN